MTERATSTLSAILIDDEQLAREELSYLLKEFPDVEILATGRNGLEAVKLIENLEPDVVFLDVQMPGLDGFGVIQNLREKNIPLPHFILATAYDQYAIQAFRWEALDYLLKPIEKDRLMVAVERARKAVTEKSKAAPQPEIAPLKASAAAHQAAGEEQQSQLHRRRAGRGLRHHRRRPHHRGRDQCRGRIELPHHRRAAIQPRSRYLLARSPLVSGEHPSHQGSDPVVQVELPAPHGRQEANRSAGKPRANQAAARAAETLRLETMSTAVQSCRITIRRAKPEDAPACGQICYEAFHKINTDHNFPPDVPRRKGAWELLTMMFSHPGFYCVVAEVDGRIAGSNCLDERNRHRRRWDPSRSIRRCRIAAIGRKLMDAVLDRARERNFAGVRLVQAAFHNRSLSLYTTLGFDVREPLAVMQGPAIKKSYDGFSVRPARPSDLEACNQVALERARASSRRRTRRCH